jgi:polyisoprenyl-phosphate glycosyltransferase
MLTNKKISAISVCYRDEGNIKALYERLSNSLRQITPDYEIIYVNDASPDSSESILRTLAAQDPKLTVILQSRNFGAQNAFTAGMEQALGDAVIIMDGDLQDPPELIENFVKKWLEGYEVVYGERRKREKSMNKTLQWFYHIFYILFNKLAYILVPLDAGEFSLMDRRVVDCINSMPERDRLIRGLRAWVGFKQIGVPYIRPERYWGKSTNSFLKNIKWARKAIFSFSFKPLDYISSFATFFMFLSLLGIVIYIIFSIFSPAPKGFLTLLVVVFFLNSIQLLVLSVISEYLGRIFEEIKMRPRYISKEIINNHRENNKTNLKNDTHQPPIQ